MNEQARRRVAEIPLTPRKNLARKVKTLVAVSPPALLQLIDYLFRGWPEFEVVGSPRGARDVGRQGARLQPELIVTNVKPLRCGVYRTIQSLKRSSPGSKLILICPVKGFASGARRCGADACLETEALVGRLLRTAQNLTGTRAAASHRGPLPEK